ncbi:MAG: hypothetical protein E6I41_11890 [Chloroflexi bacterium]|nr:MAG: hypothetical protein E6I41_11890 [Chloroflexota bacterium]
MNPITTLEPEDTWAVLRGVLREVCGTDANLERLTSDAQFTEHGKQRVVRYDLEARVAELPYIQRYQWVGKYYERGDDALRVAAVLRGIGASEGSRGTGLTVPTVLAYHAPLHLLLLTYESGEPVSSAIARDTGAILAAMGGALAALHAMPVYTPAITSPETLLADLRPRLEDLSAWRPCEAPGLRTAFAQIMDEAPRLPLHLSFVHGDFGPANLLWRGGEIVVLDFDKCARGDPALDLANLLVQLRRITIRKPWKLRDFESVRPALLDAYRRRCTSDHSWENRVAWYERAILLRKVHRLLNEVRNKDPDGSVQRSAEADQLIRVFLKPSAQCGVAAGGPPLSPVESMVSERGLDQNGGVGFPVDHEVPQLSVASNPQFMLEVFRRHLKAVPGKDYRIHDCVAFRFRCRQSGSRHVLQYTLRVAEPSTGRRWDQWVTGVLYADGEASRRWEEMKAEVPERRIPKSCLTFEPVGFIPSLQMLVEVYPYDRKLRTLGSVVGGAVQGIEPSLLGRLRPGEWRVEQRTIEPTRYRTEFGAALRYVIRAHDAVSATSEEVRCYLKVYRNDRGAETFRILQSLSGSGPDGKRPYSTVKPIVYVDELRTLALEEAPGVSLTQILATNPDPSEELRLVARAVAAFNQAIHGDLKPDHIFLSNGHVTFIDLDWAALADPLLDPAQLFAYITGRVGLDSTPMTHTKIAGATFVEEYFRFVPNSWRRRFSLHCAGALLEVAAGIFRRQESRWPEKITKVIEAAQHEISEG